VGRERRLERSQFVPLPRERVFAFFADAGNLEAITPPWLRFEILTPRPIPMRPGAVIEYRLRVLGIPFRWRTVIETFDPPVSFTDSQARGPYAYWLHAHGFEEVPGGTVVRDTARYALPLGPLGSLAHALFVRRQLREIFDFRERRIRELLG
jgi:ligand-binding SRPBCC domain-containing protein